MKKYDIEFYKFNPSKENYQEKISSFGKEGWMVASIIPVTLTLWIVCIQKETK